MLGGSWEQHRPADRRAASQPTTTPLSTLLREGSAAEHREAEPSSFMSELLAGRVNAAGYAV